MGTIKMKIFQLEKGEMEEWDKNKHEKPAIKRQNMSEVLVQNEPDKVEEVHRELWRIGKNRWCQNMTEEYILTLFKRLRDEH